MNMQYARGISTAFHVRKLCIRPRHELVPQRCDSRRLQARAALAVGLEGIDASTASEVVNALKGPTLSEMLGCAQSALQVLSDAWVSATTPLAVFGPDRWGLSLLFYVAVGLLAYNLIIAAPKQ
eukprot:XP_001693946.1 predicted protein [Chlamydomonas reinhardtii]